MRGRPAPATGPRPTTICAAPGQTPAGSWAQRLRDATRAAPARAHLSLLPLDLPSRGPLGLPRQSRTRAQATPPQNPSGGDGALSGYQDGVGSHTGVAGAGRCMILGQRLAARGRLGRRRVGGRDRKLVVGCESCIRVRGGTLGGYLSGASATRV
jgi:hypothetical protein